MGRGYDRLDKMGEMWVFGKTIDDNKEFLKKHNITIPQRNTVKIDFLFHLLRIKIISRN